jgi:hypothetical protein
VVAVGNYLAWPICWPLVSSNIGGRWEGGEGGREEGERGRGRRGPLRACVCEVVGFAWPRVQAMQQMESHAQKLLMLSRTC